MCLLTRCSLVVLLLASLTIPALQAEGAPPAPTVTGTLQSGDIVAVCGDSITQQHLYSSMIAEYLLMCQPTPNASAIQFGTNGETAPGLLRRMKRDAFPFKPTVATVCYGMNDGGYSATGSAKLDYYRKNLSDIVDAFQQNGVRFIVLGGPGAVDTFSFHHMLEPVPAGTDPATVYNQTLSDFSQVAKEVAAQKGVAYANLHNIMIDAMAKSKTAYGAAYTVSGIDGVHPGPSGHLIMAYAFLKALGCNGDIGRITLDMKSGQAEATPGQKIVSVTNGAIQIESTRYPFCFQGDKLDDPNSTKGMLPFVPFNQELNRYMLVVKNAPGKNLQVTWGTQSKTYTADQLSVGINLASEFLDNPFSKPFDDIDKKIKDLEDYETKATQVYLKTLADIAVTFPDQQSNITPLVDKTVTEWRKRWDAIQVPVVTHLITVTPVN